MIRKKLCNLCAENSLHRISHTWPSPQQSSRFLFFRPKFQERFGNTSHFRNMLTMLSTIAPQNAAARPVI
jgi:hypothetical protein